MVENSIIWVILTIIGIFSFYAVIDIYDRFIEILVDEYREYTNTNSDTPDSTDIESYKKMIDCLYNEIN